MILRHLTIDKTNRNTYPTPKPTSPQLTIAEVGRQLWGELHSKQDATPAWLKSWIDRIPQFDCLCRSDFMEILKEHPPQFGDEYFPWTNRVHNEVNARLTAQGTPRPQFSLAEAYGRWRGVETHDSTLPTRPYPGLHGTHSNRDHPNRIEDI
jgi:hypothetical protein